MTELEKLKHLLEHWIEHNKEHVKTYSDWALKLGSLGVKELSEILKQIAEESKKLEGLFKKALKSIQAVKIILLFPSNVEIFY